MFSLQCWWHQRTSIQTFISWWLFNPFILCFLHRSLSMILPLMIPIWNLTRSYWTIITFTMISMSILLLLKIYYGILLEDQRSLWTNMYPLLFTPFTKMYELFLKYWLSSCLSLPYLVIPMMTIHSLCMILSLWMIWSLLLPACPPLCCLLKTRNWSLKELAPYCG